ncbi:hypothetical protein OHS71_27425 [Streptomyces sp. NBC_00377]|uniref:hypothetical protein n=1 Tax=unclassified Streptomyces TaxID=2593676 RepID=UPI002E1D9810|nr:MULTISPECIES: hypothetical protein [unclassified Streptomyces]
MSSTATAKKQHVSSGPVLDWAAGHGPVTGALSATTGAFALATTGAATATPDRPACPGSCPPSRAS